MRTKIRGEHGYRLLTKKKITVITGSQDCLTRRGASAAHRLWPSPRLPPSLLGKVQENQPWERTRDGIRVSFLPLAEESCPPQSASAPAHMRREADKNGLVPLFGNSLNCSSIGDSLNNPGNLLAMDTMQQLKWKSGAVSTTWISLQTHGRLEGKPQNTYGMAPCERDAHGPDKLGLCKCGYKTGDKCAK